MSNRFLSSLRKKFHENEKKRTLLPPEEHGLVEEKKKKSILNSKNVVVDDPSIYQYDEVYESLDRAPEQSNRSSIIFNDNCRGAPKIRDQRYRPKYMKNLLESAANRQMENERRRERKIQKERKDEESKGEFLDKDIYITDNHRKRLKLLEMDKKQIDDEDDDDESNGRHAPEVFSVSKSLQESMNKKESQSTEREDSLSPASSEADSHSDAESKSIMEEEKTMKKKRITIADLRKKSEKERMRDLRMFMEKKTVREVYDNAVKMFNERQLKLIKLNKKF